ncbi:DnaB-like helicase C-terminal domain-containing protein [Amycolatopsis sp. NPDC051373]|uniref:replicative DNA helicase n=1 Tax=Amycolatopsis sp. NPDC051373 TaxID=3155801 RepID=UPI003450199D
MTDPDDRQHRPANLAAEALRKLEPIAEEHYLVSLLLTLTARQLRDEALAQIAPDDFSSAELGGLWETARRLHAAGKAINARSLAANAETHGENAERVLAGFTGVVPDPVDFPHSLAEVRRCGKLRRIVLATVTMQQRIMAAGDEADALAAAHDELAKLDTDTGQQDRYSHRFRDLLTTLDGQLRNPETFRVFESPWPEINERIAGGLQPGRMTVIGARPGEGKSIAGHQIAEHAAELGHPAIVFSVEMGGVEVAGRVVANGATIEMGEISRRRLSDDGWAKFNEYRARAQDYPLTINDKPDLTIGYITATCRAVKRQTGLDVAVIDYLQLLKSERNVPREQQVAHISRSLKQLSRELDIAVVVPAQLNRQSVSRGKALLSDLRESGGIEQDADLVVLLARELSDKGEPTGYININIAKNRFGPLHELDLQWRPHYSRIG